MKKSLKNYLNHCEAPATKFLQIDCALKRMQINYLTLDKDRKAATTTTITKANKHVIKKYGKEPRKATRKAK